MQTHNSAFFRGSLGVAYRVDDKTVVRSGFGITVDPESLRDQAQAYPLLISSTTSGANSYVAGGNFTTGIPAVTLPSLNTGNVPLPYNVSTWTLPQNFRRGYIESWNLAVQRELPGSLVANVAYVGNHAVRAQAQVNINASYPGGGTAGRQLNVKYGTAANPNFNNTDMLGQNPFASSEYNALQAQLTRHTENHGSFGMIYTKSKAIDSADQGAGSTLFFAYPDYWSRNRALAGFDRTNNYQWWTLEPLPFGNGQLFLQKGVSAAILGGWHVQTVLSWLSGTPFTVQSSGSALNAPGNVQVADQLVPHVKILGGHNPGKPYFDISNFAVPTGARFGTAGRNSIRGPGFFNLDAGIKRNIPLNERLALQLQAEAFDLTNTPQFANPSGVTASTTNGFGIITASNVSRSMRFSGRFIF